MAKQFKYCLEDLSQLAKNKNGFCHSLEYIGIKTKYKWECDENHTWMATLDSITQGKWCPFCANLKRSALKKKYNINDLVKFANKKDGKCISKEYINDNTKYSWLCNLGHEWQANWRNILNNKWCPYCSGHKGTTLDTLKMHATTLGGKCKSTGYITNKLKYIWCCNLNHEWEASWDNIKSGKWCPKCQHKVSKQETEIYQYIRQFEPIIQSNIRGLLINKKFELDIYNPLTKKAIEFDGEYWHKGEISIKRDLIKNQQCKDAGINLLRVRYSDYIKNPIEVRDFCKQFLVGI